MRRCGTRRDWMLIGTMAVIIGAGCSGDFDYGETGRVSGRLTFEGKPLVAGHGVIIMEPAKGYLAYGETDSDGRYEVNSWNNGDMPVGTYKVRIGGPPAPRRQRT